MSEFINQWSYVFQVLSICFPIVVSCCIFGAIAGGIEYFHADDYRWHDRDIHDPTTIDNLRQQYKREGLVLHNPSYARGVEAYCEPRWQNNDNMKIAEFPQLFNRI